MGLLTFDEQVRDYLPARHRAGHLRRLMLHLERPAAGKATDLIAPLRRIVEIVRKRSLMVLISDLLVPAEPLERNLTALTACGHEVIVFHLLDPAELAFEFDQAVMFRDLESGRDLFLDPARAARDCEWPSGSGDRSGCDPVPPRRPHAMRGIPEWLGVRLGGP